MREPPDMEAVIPPWSTSPGLLKYSVYWDVERNADNDEISNPNRPPPTT
jgi:hypothetical protein